MKECAYCGSSSKKITGEHVIPDGLLELFPEQDITFSQDNIFKDNEGLKIKDVCETCNNNVLSSLDSYGISLIRDNFMCEFKEDDKFQLEYEYNKLSRWLMKIAYNTDRVSKIKNKIFKKSINYILESDESVKPLFSLFGGIYVDMTAFGVQNEGLYYLPLQVIKQPYLLPKGIVYEYLNGSTNDGYESLTLSSANTWYIFRFASAVFILILWEENSRKEEIIQDKELFTQLFPFFELCEDKTNITLERVTDNFSCKNIAVVDGKEGITITDKFIEKVLGNRSIYEIRKEMDKFNTPERIKKGRLINELSMFPNNKNLKRDFENLYNNS